MAHPITEQWIQEATIHYEVKGHSFSVHVRFTPLGEVIELENHFLQLPPEARQLILGKEHHVIVPQIRAKGELLRFQLPCLLGTKTIPTELANVHQQLKDIQQEWRKTPAWNAPEYIEDPWVQQRYRTHHAPSWKLMEGLRELLFNWQNFWLHTTAVYSEELGGQLLALPLWTIIPLLPTPQSLRHAYRSLRFFPSPQARSGLLEALKQEKKKPFRVVILEALQPYQEPEILRIAYYFFQQKEKLDFQTYKAVLLLFGSFRSPQTEEIIEKELIHSHIEVAKAAAQVLKKWEYSKEEIADILDHYRYTLPGTKHIKSLFTQYLHLQDMAFYPSPASVLDLWQKAVLAGSTSPLTKDASLLMAPFNQRTIEPLFLNRMNTTKSGLTIAVLELMGLLGSNTETKYRPSQQMIETILHLTTDRLVPVQTRALRTLGMLRIPEPPPSFWPHLATLLEHKNPSIRDATLSTLANVLPKMELDDRILPPLHALCSLHQPPASLAKVIKALSFFNDRRSQEQCFQLFTSHRDQRVWIAAFQAVLQWSYGGIRMSDMWTYLLFDSPLNDHRSVYINELPQLRHPQKAAWLERLKGDPDSQVQRQARKLIKDEKAFGDFVLQLKINRRDGRHQDTMKHPMIPTIKRTFNVHWWQEVYQHAPKNLRQELDEILHQERHFLRQLLDFYPELPIPPWIKRSKRPQSSGEKQGVFSQIRKFLRR